MRTKNSHDGARALRRLLIELVDEAHVARAARLAAAAQVDDQATRIVRIDVR